MLCNLHSLIVENNIMEPQFSIPLFHNLFIFYSADHQKNTNCWWTENGADKKDKNKFVLSQHDLHK